MTASARPREHGFLTWSWFLVDHQHVILWRGTGNSSPLPMWM